MQNSKTFLHHGSKVAGLNVLTPFPSDILSGRSVVFATSDIRFALAMIYGTDKEFAIGYFINQETDEREMYLQELEPNALDLLDVSGVLYECVREGFVLDPALTDVEFISREPVYITKETYIPNILTELKKDGTVCIIRYRDEIK